MGRFRIGPMRSPAFFRGHLRFPTTSRRPPRQKPRRYLPQRTRRARRDPPRVGRDRRARRFGIATQTIIGRKGTQRAQRKNPFSVLSVFFAANCIFINNGLSVMGRFRIGPMRSPAFFRGHLRFPTTSRRPPRQKPRRYLPQRTRRARRDPPKVGRDRRARWFGVATQTIIGRKGTQRAQRKNPFSVPSVFSVVNSVFISNDLPVMGRFRVGLLRSLRSFAAISVSSAWSRRPPRQKFQADWPQRNAESAKKEPVLDASVFFMAISVFSASVWFPIEPLSLGGSPIFQSSTSIWVTPHSTDFNTRPTETNTRTSFTYLALVFSRHAADLSQRVTVFRQLAALLS